MKLVLLSLLIFGSGLEVYAADLSASLSRVEDGAWIAYRVPLEDPARAPCCLEWDSTPGSARGCKLAPRSGKSRSFGISDRDPPPQPGEALAVYVRRGRSERRHAGFDRVLAVRTSCPVDTSGERVTELGELPAADSVAMLERGAPEHDLLFAIAHHRGPAATQALIRLTSAGEEKAARRDAYFWLAEARGAAGFAAVREALSSSRDEELKKHLVFCLSQSRETDAARELARTATDHRDDEVRAEALFWLAETRRPGAEKLIRAALDRETSPEVQKKAVFALSQLPADRAIAALKELIESRQPRPIRREALFWLAQIQDDAVFPIFDQLLR